MCVCVCVCMYVCMYIDVVIFCTNLNVLYTCKTRIKNS